MTRLRGSAEVFGSHGDYTVVLKDGTELIMSRGYRSEFEVWLRQPL